jgi:hypothetical protein
LVGRLRIGEISALHDGARSARSKQNLKYWLHRQAPFLAFARDLSIVRAMARQSKRLQAAASPPTMLRDFPARTARDRTASGL